MFSEVWHKISMIGIKEENIDYSVRRNVLTNRINFLLLATTFIVFLIDGSLNLINRDFGANELRVFFISLICALNIFLNSKGFFNISRLFLIVFPVFFLIIYPGLFGNVIDEFFFWAPYVIIALSILPLILFSYSTERPLLLSATLYCFLLLLFCEKIFEVMGESDLHILYILKQHFLFIKIAQIAIFVFINLSVLYLIRINRRYENQLSDYAVDLEDKNVIIEQQKEELQQQNYILKDQKEELLTQNEELQSFQEELNVQNEKLKEALEKLKEMQDQLLESEKLASIGVLTAGIAHEINNPINFISSGIQGLKSVLGNLLEVLKRFDALEKSTCAEHLASINELKEQIGYKKLVSNTALLMERIEQGIERTTDIINGLRTFSKLDVEDLESGNIHHIIDDVLVLLDEQLAGNISVEKDYNTVPEIKCFSGRLNQVFMNVISNAIHAIEGEGTIKITTRSKPSEVTISIKDNGIGISKSNRSKVFDPFYTTKEVGEGSGLGLAISYSIIQKHRGSIEFESEEGKGTEFKIILPIDPTRAKKKMASK